MTSLIGKRLKQRDACVAFVMQIDRFFKVEPPLAFDWLDSARNSRGCVGPVHVQLRGQLAGDVMTASANSSFVRFLQSEHVDRRQQLSARESVCGDGNQVADVLRTAREAHQSQLPSDAAGNQIRTTRVTNVVGSDDEFGAFGICRVIVRMSSELEFLGFG